MAVQRQLQVIPAPADDDAPDMANKNDDYSQDDRIEQSKSVNVWLIVGISAGAVAIVSIIAAYIVKRAKSKRE